MRWTALGSAAFAAGLGAYGLVKLIRDDERVMKTVDVYVMLQLNAAEIPIDQLCKQMKQLKDVGVKGVMMDFWWSRVEKEPGYYDWSDYEKIVLLAKELGLRMQCVMAFHTCGEADGDNFVVKLPHWVVEAAKRTPGVFYEDEFGVKSEEYISIGSDLERILPGRSLVKRTPIEAYSGFFKDFKRHFKSYLGSTITEVQVGLGPCGELRYPGYAVSKWTFPGIGAFQCYDPFLLGDYQRYARQKGIENTVPPAKGTCGSYDSTPEETEFFKTDGLYSTTEGRIFLEWYFSRLAEHGDRLLEAARTVFGPEITLSCKVAGVHWCYNTASRAAEATSGYYHANGFDCYGKLSAMLKKHNATFLFTCMEKKDKDEPSEGRCSPQSLVRETARSASLNGVKYGGENALEFKKWSFYRQIVKTAAQCQTLYPDLDYECLTLLRLDETLMKSSHINHLEQFIKRMTMSESG